MKYMLLWKCPRMATLAFLSNTFQAIKVRFMGRELLASTGEPFYSSQAITADTNLQGFVQKKEKGVIEYPIIEQ